MWGSDKARRMRISVVGGGRWARTIASVLCALPDRTDHVTLHSPSNSAALETWAAERAFGARLCVEKGWPASRTDGDRPDAVIVANRVADHFRAAAGSLNKGIPVLVEKPVSLSAGAIERLSDMARAAGTFLAASHVMLFSRYFQAYAAAATALGEGQGLRFTWTDGAGDIVRQEVKSYDAAVTVFDDVLPHILPMIGQLKFDGSVLEAIEVQRGGALLNITLRANGRPVSVLLARNDTGRRRRIEFHADAGAAMLEFATEPGTIEIADQRQNGDPLWDRAPRPLATMLIAFLAAVEGSAPDARLSPKLAIATASLATTIRRAYVEHQAGWLEQRLGRPLDEPLMYALTELSADEGRSPEAISQTWSAIADRAGLAVFLSRSGLRSGDQDK